MVFFNVTGFDGKQEPVNTETIKYCQAYDRDAMRRELLSEARRDHPSESGTDSSGGEFAGIDPGEFSELRKAFASIDMWNTKIHFIDGTWISARETPEQVRQLANAALSEVMAARHTIEASPVDSTPQHDTRPVLRPT